VRQKQLIRNVTDEIVRAINALRKREDAASRYQLAVQVMSLYGWTPKARLLKQARDELTSALELRPKHARSHALLGHVHDLDGETEAALARFREARRLKPADRVYEAYVLTLLEESGAEREALAEIEAAAPRHGVDLPALRREVIAAGLRPDSSTLLSGFIRARNFFKSSLADEAERILNTLKPGRARAQAEAERKRCAEDQRELRRSFDASRVPQSIRALAKWASRYGVGDDACRPYLLGRLPKKQRAALIRGVDKHAQAIQAWIDSFGKRLMPAEAAAFMYLALGVEEIRE
jgi:lipopolysaccharide biosynthesis regulator YciM